GWVYGLQDGRLRDLDITTTSRETLELRYRNAMSTLLQQG
ncbi:carbonate dehydratase, partial [Escherichia coli]|nr:carbonate dehydratase [Escherichia coli]